MKNKYRTLATDTVLMAISSLGTKIITFLMVPFYTNILTTNEYGIVDLLLVASNLVVPICSLSLGDAVLRFGLNKNYDSNDIIKFSLIETLIGSSIVFALSPVFSLYLPLRQWVLYFCFIVCLEMFRNILTCYARATNHIKDFAIDALIYTFIISCSNILFLKVFKLAIRGYFLALIIGGLASCIYLFISCKCCKALKEGKYDKELSKKLVIFSSPMIVNALSWAIFSFADRMMIQKFLGEELNGLYAAASKIPSILSAVTVVFTQAWNISAIKEYDSERDRNFYKTVFEKYSFVLVISCSIILCVDKPFMSVYVGDEFREAWRIAPFLIIGALFSAYASYFGAFYSAAMKNIMVTITTLAAAISNIVLNYLFINLIGVNGAALATMLSYVILALFRMINSRRYIKLDIDFFRLSCNWGVILFQGTLLSRNKYMIRYQLVLLFALLLLNAKQFVDLIKTGNHIVLKIINHKKGFR